MTVKNWENVIDEIGCFSIIVRSMVLDRMLKGGIVVDIYVEDYSHLADFTYEYDVCMITLRGDFVRLVVHEKR